MSIRSFVLRDIVRIMAVLALLVSLSCNLASGNERPDWDQKEAIAKVKEVIAIEETGKLPWDEIAWESNIDSAISRAQAEDMPLLVYLYLQKDSGPPEAPC
ncbi:MAG: hypothetical protein AAF236_09795 [Verrucomicrobiota bacterium]